MNSTLDFVKKSAELNKYAAICVRILRECLSFYLECYLLSAQRYLSFVSADRASAASRGLLDSFSSPKLSSQSLFSVMERLVTATRNRESKSNRKNLRSVQQAKKAVAVLEIIINYMSRAPIISNQEPAAPIYFLNATRSLIKHFQLHKSNSGLSAFILFTDAAAVLYVTSIDQDKIEPSNKATGSTHINTFLVLTMFERFQRRDETKWRVPDVQRDNLVRISENSGQQKTLDWRSSQQRFCQNDKLQQALANTFGRFQKQNQPSRFQWEIQDFIFLARIPFWTRELQRSPKTSVLSFFHTTFWALSLVLSCRKTNTAVVEAATQ